MNGDNSNNNNGDKASVPAVAVTAKEVVPPPPKETGATVTSNGSSTGQGEKKPTTTDDIQNNKKDDGSSYSLKVKQEYILKGRPSSLRPLPATMMMTDDVRDNRGDDRDRDDRNNNNRNKKNKRKGRNKKRPRDARQHDSEKICMSAIRGEGSKCPWGDKCRFSHDIEAYMRTRPTDIQEVEGGCPIFNETGYCVYGATCRVGSNHITKSGENITRSSNDGEKSKATNTTSSNIPLNDQALNNILPKEIQTQLRKKTYPFKCKRYDDNDATGGKRNNHHNKNKQGREEDSSSGPKKKEDEEEKTVVTENSNNDDVTTTTMSTTTTSTQEEKKPTTPMVLETVEEEAKPSTIQKSLYGSVETKTRKIIDFSNKVYLAPLTTVGNLPFRRIVKKFGVDITCGEMAVATNLLEGRPSEWALLKRHPDEDIFGIQLAAAHADQFTRVSELIENYCTADFIDLNLGCPIDLICNKGAGSALMMRDKKLKGILEGMTSTLSCPITIKMRTGWTMDKPFAHELVPKIQRWGIPGVDAIMIHGRSRLQRYQRLADWEYINKVAASQSNEIPKIPLIGNGDVFSSTDYEAKMANAVDGVSPTAMLGRGALIKPWLPTEIKERRHWDISSSERLDMLKEFVRFGLEHWGSDQQGVNNTRRFLLEWLSFLYRYVPVGLLEQPPQQMNQRPPAHMQGRNDLETLFMSANSADWIQISEMLLGPVPEGFRFEPKHKANSYA